MESSILSSCGRPDIQGHPFLSFQPSVVPLPQPTAPTSLSSLKGLLCCPRSLHVPPKPTSLPFSYTFPSPRRPLCPPAPPPLFISCLLTRGPCWGSLGQRLLCSLWHPSQLCQKPPVDSSIYSDVLMKEEPLVRCRFGPAEHFCPPTLNIHVELQKT